jgi:hypothetical protein
MPPKKSSGPGAAL